MPRTSRVPVIPTNKFWEEDQPLKKATKPKPRLSYQSDGTTPVLLLVAKEDPPVGTELKYDYGITRSSFGGERGRCRLV